VDFNEQNPGLGISLRRPVSDHRSHILTSDHTHMSLSSSPITARAESLISYNHIQHQDLCCQTKQSMVREAMHVIGGLTVLYACHQGPRPNTSTVRIPTTASIATRPLYSSPSSCNKQPQRIRTKICTRNMYHEQDLPHWAVHLD
jgi:hypothetical protein